MAEPDGALKGSELAALSLQLGGAVALPTLLLVWGGHALDQRLHTGNLWLFVGIAAALFASLGFVWVIVQRALKR